MYIPHQLPPKFNNQISYPSNQYGSVKQSSNRPIQFDYNQFQTQKRLGTDPYSHNNFTYSPNNYPSNQKYKSENQKGPQNIGLENKSFLEKFDNNSSVFLGEKSHARNIRGRLMSNNEPSAERAKQEKLKQYRDQLQKQIQADKERKQAQKKKIEEQQLKRERKFYEEFKIEAQKGKKEPKPDENPYIMMRTLQKSRKVKPKQLNNITEIPTQLSYPDRKKSDGGYSNYHPKYDSEIQSRNQKRHQSSLEEQLARDRQFEEERIAKILLFQRNVLKKLSDIKHEIRATDNLLGTDSDLQRIRNSLRARSHHRNFAQELKKSSNIDKSRVGNSSQFYSLPKKNTKPVLPTMKPQSFQLQLNDLKGSQMNKQQKNKKRSQTQSQYEQSRIQQNAESRFTDLSPDKHSVNDKNIISEEPHQNSEDLQ